MQNNKIFRRLHATLTVTLLLLVAGYAFCRFYVNRAPEDALYAQRRITESTFLYVTKYQGGGATVSEVYRYYLDGVLPGDPMPHLKERTPFLVTDVGNAGISGYGNHINVTLTGRVYMFTNSDLFYAEGVAIMPVISLTANGVR
ncbi:hypothetical protein [Chimaeribacter arupi]|uniref:Uncharacterized protein n=1 Tax=Chimaeribacter arupi TaxID=2060066 RepID=A0A2N5ENY7_9GAMM|nr:hypothetical protein [Chimaeribacter arupi]PLR50673.1 hypothetical protein CYR34_09220 [Chimaeribacter arupi]